MRIAKLLTFSDLLTPLHTLANRWMAVRQGSSKPMRYVAIRPSRPAGTPHFKNGKQATVKPLRVVRLVDAQAPFTSSRLVISGRMDEVCAELARLAALESRDSELRTTHLH